MRICEVIADKKYKRILITIAEKQGAIDYWWSSDLEDGRQIFTMVVTDDTRQSLIDSLQVLFEEDKKAKILILPVDASIPRLQESKESGSEISSKTTREELFDQVTKGVSFNLNYGFMVILSSIVATIGLSEDNIAVIVGAMVIAPLLGPNLALSFAATIGSKKLIISSLKSLLMGILLTLCVTFSISFFADINFLSNEILLRTKVGIGDIVLALASGAAAALSMTTGISASLVGVMVSVALLPPAASFAILLANEKIELAAGALILLLINTVCVQISGSLAFLYQGFRGRTYIEREEAKSGLAIFTIFWTILIAILIIGLIFYKV